MKKQIPFNYAKKVMYLLFCFVFLLSCDKLENTQKFDDVFDISGVIELNQKIESAKTQSDLSGVFENVTLNIPDGMKDISLDEMIDHYKSNIKLSSKEIDLLLKNDSKTYIDVINRFGCLPPQIRDLNIDFGEIKSSSLNKFLVVQKSDTENFYSDDYYSAVLALQDFIKDAVIRPMSSLKSKVVTIGPGNPNLVPDDDDGIPERYKLITSNNIWVMWWAYWSDGTRTKHRGAQGDPNNPVF